MVSNVQQFVPFKQVGTDTSTKVANLAQQIDRLKPTINVETLAAARTLLVTDYICQWLDPGGTDRDVTLPAEASSTNLMFIILNTSDGAGEDLVVKNDAAATIGTLGPGMSGIFSCDGTSWKWEDETGLYFDKITGNETIYGHLYVEGQILSWGTLSTTGLVSVSDNQTSITSNISVTGADTTAHTIKSQIDDNDIIVAQATGNGSGGIVDKAVGFYGHTPGTQPAAIADPAESTAGNNAAIDAILAALRSTGLIAT